MSQGTNVQFDGWPNQTAADKQRSYFAEHVTSVTGPEVTSVPVSFTVLCFANFG